MKRRGKSGSGGLTRTLLSEVHERPLAVAILTEVLDGA